MIRCIAIDDEPLALRQIAWYIKKTPFLELVAQFKNALQAIDFIQNNEVDLMFVDINMPELSGLDFVKSLKDAPGIIFTTAYSEYAIEGFKVDAMDYLLKPIGYSDFLKSANKARERFELQEKASPEIKTEKDFLLIRSEHKIIRINYSDIKYIEGMREYVRFFLTSQKPIMTLMSMKKLEEILPASVFMRVHRSYIVNLEKITIIEKFRIIFDNRYFFKVNNV